jgi:hypothetical protein
MCPMCYGLVGVLADAQPDSLDELAMHCPACEHRWVWRDPDSTEPEQSHHKHASE